jgi:hypothetical protein
MLLPAGLRERAMTNRVAKCSCGQLSLTCEGEPVRVSLCHCLACQQRTGSVFGVTARFNKSRVAIEGRSTRFVRKGDEGSSATFRFCPDCGSTVYWQSDVQPDVIAIAVGCFADPDFPGPTRAVYEGRQHLWSKHLADHPMERYA